MLSSKQLQSRRPKTVSRLGITRVEKPQEHGDGGLCGGQRYFPLPTAVFAPAGHPPSKATPLAALCTPAENAAPAGFEPRPSDKQREVAALASTRPMKQYSHWESAWEADATCVATANDISPTSLKVPMHSARPGFLSCTSCRGGSTPRPGAQPLILSCLLA